jgi:hypothetical protein
MIPNIDYYLYLYPKIDEEISAIKNKMEESVAARCDMKVTASISGMPNGSSSSCDKIVEILIICDEIRKDAMLSISILECMKACITKEFHQSDPLCSRVIEDRYFAKMRWDEIIELHGITINAAYITNCRFKQRVLDEFKRIFVIKG